MAQKKVLEKALQKKGVKKTIKDYGGRLMTKEEIRANRINAYKFVL